MGGNLCALFMREGKTMKRSGERVWRHVRESGRIYIRV